MPRRLRVAAVVRAPAAEVRAAVDTLPSAITAYVVETGAGVLVTLERSRRGPLSTRRRSIRSLQEELAKITGRFAGDTRFSS